VASGLNLVFICQAVDPDDLILASTVRWIRLLAGRPDVAHVGVITLRAGAHGLPHNVDVVEIGGARGRARRIAAFYAAVGRLTRGRRVDAFFVYQGGPYPALLLPYRLLAGIPIFQWKAHPYVSWPMWFYARFCDTRVFTSTPGAFPLDLPNISVVGNGIDVQEFSLRTAPPTRDLVTVGRLSRSKQIERILEAMAVCRRRFGRTPSLDVLGPRLDEGYADALARRVEALGLEADVTFAGGVPRSALPEALGRYRLFVNVSATALDRAVLEAMACGVPVVSSNPCVREIVPEGCRDLLSVPAGDAEALAERLHQLVALDSASRERLGRALREVVVRDHSDVSQWERIVRLMAAERRLP
jgi:glycosyltransferase involved in cell wall biosynthesis